jgi:tetratricopeptide (TPR) repeat protein
MDSSMNRSMRLVLSTATVAGAALGLYACCVRPLMCNVREARLEQITLHLAQQTDSSETQQQARANLKSAIECIRVQPANVNLYMIAAANCRVQRQPERAIEFYEQALQFDRRREILANLGNVQSEIGKKRDAIDNLVRANIFWGDYLNDIEDPFVHDEVLRRYKAYEASLKRGR